MNTKKKDIPPCGTGVNERCFVIPAGFDPDRLVKTLARWLAENLDQETEVSEKGAFRVIHSRDTGGRLKRLIKRKAQTLHIAMKTGQNHLWIQIGYGRWKEAEKAEESGGSGFNLLKMASSTLNNAVGIAGTAADGLSDMLTETVTIDRIFRFTADLIASDFRAQTGLPPTGIDSSQSRYVEPMTDLESAWLAGFREPGEIMLAWLKTSSGDRESGNEEWRYLLTSRRAALAAFSGSAFIAVKPLPSAVMTVTDVIGRDTVTLSGLEWRTQLGNDMLFREIAPLSPLSPLERFIEAARLNYIHRHKDEVCRRHAEALLAYALSLSPDPLTELTLFYVRGMGKEGNEESVFERPAHDESVPGMLRSLTGTCSGSQLAEWADAWQVSPWNRILLARSIAENNEDNGSLWIPLVSPIVSASREVLLKNEKNPAHLVATDVMYAMVLGGEGRETEAVELLEKRMAQLPDETLSDLLPLKDTDLTKGEGGQLLKTKLLECLAAIQREGPRHPEIIRKLAVLQPMVPERLHKLRTICGDDLKRKVSCLLEILGAGGLSIPDSPPDHKSPGCNAVSPSLIEERLRHPAGREGSFLRKVGGFLAVKQMPDHSALKAYAKKITPAAFPSLTAALADGAMMLGMPTPEGYISFGDLNTGVRGYEGSPAFLLVGSEHIEEGAESILQTGELRFLIGAELAHIKFKHERITSREVWEGAFDKAMTLVELVPVLGGYLGKIGALGKFAGQAADVAKRVGDIQSYISQARDVTSSAQSILGGKKKEEALADSGPLSQDEQNLLFAFRIMQLTADRAGLLLCGDIRAAVRAMFQSAPALVPELPTADAYGLDAFLSREDENGDLMFQHLAIRLAALFSFYLSEDYERLRQAALPV